MEVLCAANACLDLIIYRVGSDSGRIKIPWFFPSARPQPDYWSGFFDPSLTIGQNLIFHV